jgi:hypothetical protein
MGTWKRLSRGSAQESHLLETTLTLWRPWMDENLERRERTKEAQSSHLSPGARSEYKYKYEFIPDAHHLGASN